MPDVKLLVQNTLEFLSRTDLKGKEAMAFTECVYWLNSFLHSKPEAQPDKVPAENVNSTGPSVDVSPTDQGIQNEDPLLDPVI